MTTAIPSCPFGGATLHTTADDVATGGGGVKCGDFLRKFADAVRYQTMSITGLHVSPDAGNETSYHDSLFGDDSVSDLASSSTTSSPSFPSQTSTADRKLKLSSGRHRSRRKEVRNDYSVNNLCELVPVSGARRNERERNRVRQVNAGFDRLRDHVPQGRRNRKLSKVDTLRAAVDYIAQLQLVLGGPCSMSSSTCSMSQSPGGLDSADVGLVLRDFNDNNINCGLTVNGSYNKQYPVVPDESSSSSATSMTELLFQMAATATATSGENANGNVFSVVGDASPKDDDYGRRTDARSTSVESCMSDAYCAKGIIFSTTKVEEETRRVRHCDSASLSSPSARYQSSYYAGYFSVSSSADEETSMLMQVDGSAGLTAASVEHDVDDLTAWLHDQRR